MPSGPVALLGSRASRALDTSSVVKLMSHRAWSDGSGSVGVGSGWSLLLNTDVKYSLNVDAISAGLEAVRVGVDTPSPTPIDMVSERFKVQGLGQYTIYICFKFTCFSNRVLTCEKWPVSVEKLGF